MSAHTPGPWFVKRSLVPHDGEYDFAINAIDGPVLAEAFGLFSNGTVAQAEANARLIAAAPDLLAACQAVLDEFPALDGKRIESVKRICRAAIARATVAS